MKKILINKILAVAMALLVMVSCTDKFEEINTDPNNPAVVTTSSLMTNAQKALMDDIYDEWWGGRQGYLYPQYFAQRAYTEEDRYQPRNNINNNYWTFIYNDIMDLVEIIRLNEEAGELGSTNEIAAARILKAWAMQIMTDTYGDVPYLEAFKGRGEITPAYTPQNVIYADLIKELTEASAQLNVDEPIFVDNPAADVIYNSDAAQWRKFANSLKLRVAIRMSKVDPANSQKYIAEALDPANGGVFTGNADNAVFQYEGTTSNVDMAPMWDAYFYSNRNDFTLSNTFVDLLRGADDELNGKTNPIGVYDPRLNIFAGPAASPTSKGMPYGVPSTSATAARAGSINLRTSGGVTTAGNLGLTFMDYAEVCFIRSEVNGWDQDWYEEGVKASFEHWEAQAAEAEITMHPKYDSMKAAYIAALPPASAETVLTQKYIALYMQGYEAWAEYRRTGYPRTLLHPGEITAYNGMVFTTLGSTADIPRRLTYPEIEQSINGESYTEAVGRIDGKRDVMDARMWWDVE